MAKLTFPGYIIEYFDLETFSISQIQMKKTGHTMKYDEYVHKCTKWQITMKIVSSLE